MMKMPEVDGNLQPVPLVCQAKVFYLKAGINVTKLHPEVPHGALDAS